MLVLDGAQGEGGGQIVRSALALSLCTGAPFRIDGIRANRARPGLGRQHLTAVRAAAQLGTAEVRGAQLGSTRLDFAPRAVRPGEYRFEVGTAGSTTLVYQTVLPALLTAGAPTRLTLSGGTHNPLAPPFEFIARAFNPLVERLGPRLSAELRRPGFFPAGGGEWRATIEPAARLAPFELPVRGAARGIRARVLLSGLPQHVAERELAALRDALDLAPDQCEIAERSALSPGNAILLELIFDEVTEVISALGERGKPAESVAAAAIAEAQDYLRHTAPVGPHLADQLLLPLALAGGGSFRTGPLTLHARTNMAVIEQFLPIRFESDAASDGVTIRVRPR
jgi:RNA 3'-terminal phosphate cyclase (ATP)